MSKEEYTKLREFRNELRNKFDKVDWRESCDLKMKIKEIDKELTKYEQSL